MNPDPSELLPCPFCGELPVFKGVSHTINEWAVYHNASCYYSGITWMIGEQQLANWNTRYTPKPSAGDEGLESAAKEIGRTVMCDPAWVLKVLKRHITYADKRNAEMVNKWQPIETAPKDGTRILVYVNVLVFIAEYIKNQESWWVASNTTIDEPTHWMPIPTIDSAIKQTNKG